MTVGFLLWGIYCGKPLKSQKLCNTRVLAKKSFCSPKTYDFFGKNPKNWILILILGSISSLFFAIVYREYIVFLVGYSYFCISSLWLAILLCLSYKWIDTEGRCDKCNKTNDYHKDNESFKPKKEATSIWFFF